MFCYQVVVALSTRGLLLALITTLLTTGPAHATSRYDGCLQTLLSNSEGYTTEHERFFRLGQLLHIIKHSHTPEAVQLAAQAFVEDLTPILQGYFYKRDIRDPATRDDLVQEVLLKLLMKNAEWDPGIEIVEETRRFIFGQARIAYYRTIENNFYGLYRGDPSERGNEAEFIADSHEEDLVLQDRDWLDVKSALARLTDANQRGVMGLYLQHCSVDQIAAKLHLTPDQVMLHYHQSVRGVRRYLGVEIPKGSSALSMPLTQLEGKIVHLRAQGVKERSVLETELGQSGASAACVLSQRVVGKAKQILLSAGVDVRNKRNQARLSLKDLRFNIDPFDASRRLYITYKNPRTFETVTIEGHVLQNPRARVVNYVNEEAPPIFSKSAAVLEKMLMHFEPSSSKIIRLWAAGRTYNEIVLDTAVPYNQVKTVVSLAANRLEADWYEITQSDFEWILEKFRSSRFDLKTLAREFYLHNVSARTLAKRLEVNPETAYRNLDGLAERVRHYAKPTPMLLMKKEVLIPVRADKFHLLVVPDDSKPNEIRIELDRTREDMLEKAK